LALIAPMPSAGSASHSRQPRMTGSTGCIGGLRIEVEIGD
jgi:hypothetical protein